MVVGATRPVLVTWPIAGRRPRSRGLQSVGGFSGQDLRGYRHRSQLRGGSRCPRSGAAPNPEADAGGAVDVDGREEHAAAPILPGRELRIRSGRPLGPPLARICLGTGRRDLRGGRLARPAGCARTASPDPGGMYRVRRATAMTAWYCRPGRSRRPPHDGRRRARGRATFARIGLVAGRRGCEVSGLGLDGERPQSSPRRGGSPVKIAVIGTGYVGLVTHRDLPRRERRDDDLRGQDRHAHSGRGADL